MNSSSFAITSKTATLAGIFSIIVWSSNVAVSKTVMNATGAYNAAFYIYFFSGIIYFFILYFSFGRGKFFGRFRSLPLKYYLQTGIFFIFNNVFFYAALGLARTNEELIIVCLLNYLWPVLIFVLRVPVYKLKIVPGYFYPSVAAAIAGIVIALLQGYTLDELYFIVNAMDDNFLAFLFALIGAFSWALYSNLIRKNEAENDIAAMPVIFILSGLVFFFIQLFRGEIHTIDLTLLYSNPYLIYTILAPTSLGYLFWFFAMKNGNRNLVTSLSYLIPLASVFLIGILHSTPIQPMFWLSAVLIVSGAALGTKGIV